jgi:hypothetical protein
MSKVWLAIPSARPTKEASLALQQWTERGYGVALWRDSESDAPACNLLATGTYPGYAIAVNALAKRVLEMDPECDWIVAGGDDTLPDPRDPNEIAAECTAHFGGTLGVMQPTGDRWAGGSIDRIAGSPWMGREWCMRANGGAGPLWPEFAHMFVDQALQETATRCGCFWQRQDITHMHQHYLRDSERIDAGVRYAEPPAHLKKWNSQQHWRDMQAIYERLRSQNFAPCMPIENARLAADVVVDYASAET